MTPNQHQKAVEEIAYTLFNPNISDYVKVPIFYMGVNADMFLNQNEDLTELVNVYTDACTYIGIKHSDLYNRLARLCECKKQNQDEEN